MSKKANVHAMFFDESGDGPDSVILWTQPLPAVTISPDDARVIGPRTLGLRVRSHSGFPLLFAAAGGYQMEEATVRALYEQFGAWLDAPRDDAREAAEVVATDASADVVNALLKTAAGEWGVRTTYSDDETETDLRWFDGADDAERKARSFYAEIRGFSICTSCGAETDDDVGTIDVVLCAECAGGLVPT